MRQQPFSLQKENPLLYYRESINKIGLSSPILSEHFELIAVSQKRWKNIPQIMVSIRNIKTKQVKKVHIQSINKGHNPFNSHQEYHEREVVQPKVERFLKKHGFKKITKEECGWKDFSTPDIISKNKQGYIFVAEVKSHLKVWNRKHLENQKNKYDKLSRKFFGDKYLGIKLVCLKGKYGEKLTKKLFKF
jgi:Holliday junction resolvase